MILHSVRALKNTYFYGLNYFIIREFNPYQINFIGWRNKFNRLKKEKKLLCISWCNLSSTPSFNGLVTWTNCVLLDAIRVYPLNHWYWQWFDLMDSWSSTPYFNGLVTWTYTVRNLLICIYKSCTTHAILFQCCQYQDTIMTDWPVT